MSIQIDDYDPAIERRRHQEAERRDRIFDSKRRVMGIDVSALNNQVEEKYNRRLVEEDRHKLFDESVQQTNRIIDTLEHRVQQARQKQLRDLNEFRAQQKLTQEKRETEWQQMKNEPFKDPFEDEKHIGIRMNTFEGEDLHNQERHQQQTQQMRQWAQEKAEENARACQLEVEAKRLEAMYVRHIDALQEKLAAEQAMRTKEKAINNWNFNQQAAFEKSQRELQAKINEQLENQEEVRQTISKGILAPSPSSGDRLSADSWRGMTAEQRKAILSIQEQQRLDNERKKYEDALEEHQLAEMQKNNIRAAQLLERQQLRQQKNQTKNIALANQQLAQERRQSPDKEVRNNRGIDEAFFQQFNRSTR